MSSSSNLKFYYAAPETRRIIHSKAYSVTAALTKAHNQSPLVSYLLKDERM